METTYPCFSVLHLLTSWELPLVSGVCGSLEKGCSGLLLSQDQSWVALRSVAQISAPQPRTLICHQSKKAVFHPTWGKSGAERPPTCKWCTLAHWGAKVCHVWVSPSSPSLPSTQPPSPDIFVCRRPVPNRQPLKTGAPAGS